MTEASERLKKLIDQLENFENHETGDLDIDDVKQDLNYIYSLIRDDVTDHQTTFVVGEYYRVLDSSDVVFTQLADGNFKVMKDSEIKTYDVINFNSQFIGPATAEQVAEFKLAEAIAKTGQSADQIRQMLSNGKMPMGPWLELQKTAEELQEVGDESI